MTTTFITRETARDNLVTLFVANNSWEKVFGYFPSADEAKQRGVFLVVSSGGSDWGAFGQDTNPTDYSFSVISFVLVSDEETDGNWTEALCEDKLDGLDVAMRQIVRDNMAGDGSFFLSVSDGASQTGYWTIGGVEYRSEQRIVTAKYPDGGA